jgi:hypothetical protein
MILTLLIPGGYSPDRLRADDRYVEFVTTLQSAEADHVHLPRPLLINAKVVGRE